MYTCIAHTFIGRVFGHTSRCACKRTKHGLVPPECCSENNRHKIGHNAAGVIYSTTGCDHRQVLTLPAQKHCDRYIFTILQLICDTSCKATNRFKTGKLILDQPTNFGLKEKKNSYRNSLCQFHYNINSTPIIHERVLSRAVNVCCRAQKVAPKPMPTSCVKQTRMFPARASRVSKRVSCVWSG